MSTFIPHSSTSATVRDVPRTKRSLLAAAIAAAVLIVAVAVVISQAGSASDDAGGAPSGGSQTRALFRGIPQRGIALGDPRAPVTLTEFADLQCPFCRQYAENVLPTLVTRYVRSGGLRLVFRNLSFIGPDSERAARLAAAAGLQDRLWQFTDLVYRNQGEENSGYVTDAYLRRIAQAARVDGGRAFAAAGGAAVGRQLDASARKAQRSGVDSTPSFVLSRAGAPPRRFSPSSLTVDAFAGPIERLIDVSAHAHTVGS
jgi:protein-disulfide isomerase